MMNAALGTLPFLATLWLLAVLGARFVEESGPRIIAALGREPLSSSQAGAMPPRRGTVPRVRDCPCPTSRTQWRAAA